MSQARPVKNKNPGETELVNPRQFMSLWGLEAHEAARVVPSTDDDIKKNIAAAMNISDATVAELDAVCGKQSLFVGTEPQRKDNLYRMNEQPSQEGLQCIKHQIESNKRREEDAPFNIATKVQMKYTSLDSHMSVIPEGLNTKNTPHRFRVPTPNVILTVEITKCSLQGTATTAHKEQDNLLVLGSQSLADLRDKIRCPSDNIIPGDYSSLPDVDSRKLQTLGDMYKSSFFFIENVFYNDMREDDNKDYSKHIITWAKKHMPESKLTTKEMSQQSLFDLDISLGKYYLFTHQGNCEHSVLFTDLRLFNAVDLQDVRMYPWLSITRARTRIVCQACYTNSTKWSVSNSPIIPYEPTQLCGLCFKSLMYTKDGRKISNFKAYHFST